MGVVCRGRPGAAARGRVHVRDGYADYDVAACYNSGHVGNVAANHHGASLPTILRPVFVVCNARKHCGRRAFPAFLAQSSLVLTYLEQDDKANRTTYTAFCPKQSTDACNLALQFPFVFVEGPKTVEFHGTYTST